MAETLLKSSPKVAQVLLREPKAGPNSPILDSLSRVIANLPQISAKLPTISKSWSKLATCWGQIWQNLANQWHESARIGLKWAGVRLPKQRSSEFKQLRSLPGSLRVTSPESPGRVANSCSATSGQLYSICHSRPLQRRRPHNRNHACNAPVRIVHRGLHRQFRPILAGPHLARNQPMSSAESAKAGPDSTKVRRV